MSGDHRVCRVCGDDMCSKQTHLLIEGLRVAEDPSKKCGDGYMRTMCGAAASTIAELEAVVEKLPKTADGIRATPGMEVYVPSTVEVEWDAPPPFDKPVVEARVECSTVDGFDMGADIGTVPWAAMWEVVRGDSRTVAWVDVESSYSTHTAAREGGNE